MKKLLDILTARGEGFSLSDRVTAAVTSGIIIIIAIISNL